jgi:hypothetical protein
MGVWGWGLETRVNNEVSSSYSMIQIAAGTGDLVTTPQSPASSLQPPLGRSTCNSTIKTINMTILKATDRR